MESLFRSKSKPYFQTDFDIFVLLLNEKDHFVKNESIAFYNQRKFEKSVTIIEDTTYNRFNETIIVDFSELPSNVKRLVFTISNQQGVLFPPLKIELFIFNKPVWILPVDAEPFEIISIEASGSFNINEIFEIVKNDVSECFEVLIRNKTLVGKIGLEYIEQFIDN